MSKSGGNYSFPAPLSDAYTAEEALRNNPAEFWEKRGEKAALQLFHEAAERVPAYKDFLKREKITPDSIETAADFAQVPTIDKTNYLRAYPLAGLSWDGNLLDTWQVFAATSGSTGEPFYFPRAQKETEYYSLMAELYLRTQFKIHERSTLYVDSFAMGAWIGGLFTYQALERIAKGGNYKLHIITPGIHKEEALKAIQKLGHLYDQVIIGGYPPFTRDLLDEGISQGIQWEKYNLKFVFSAEGFGERFRDHIVEHAGIKNVYRDMLNHYGTVDQGTLAYETPLAIFMRKESLKDATLYQKLFSEPTRLPTLAQYLPEHFYFEVQNGHNLLCTSDAGLPLVRYDLKDHGGIMDFDSAWQALESSVPNAQSLLVENQIDDTVFHLPFVHIYERSDFSVVLYGANVYPEHVRKALEGSECREFATGRCTLKIIETKDAEPRLEVNIELKKGIDSTKAMSTVAQKSIMQTLIEHNSEYRSNHMQIAKKVTPQIKFWKFGDEKYFSGKGKQKWVVH